MSCLGLAYWVYWRHGPHHDDYFLYSWTFRKLVALIRHEVRPVGKIIATVIFSQPEVVARLFGVTMIIGTSFLSGLLLYRLFKIRLAAISVALLCLVPFAGTEAVTWTSAVIHFAPAGFFALLALNLFLSALRAVADPRHRKRLAFLSGLMLVLAFGSIEPAANFAVLFVGLLLVERRDQPEDTGQMLKVLSQAMLVVVIFGVLIYIKFYIGADQVTSRGTIELPSLDRIGRSLLDFHRRGFGGPFGQEMIRISNKEGWEALQTDHTAIILAFAAIALGTTMNLLWKTENILAEQKAPLTTRINIMMAALLLTTLASMLLPAVLMSREAGSPRLAYLPGISGTLFVGCCIARLMVMRLPLIWQRLVLAFVTFSVLALSVHLMGYTRMYYLRYKHDRLQVEALLKAVPRESVIGKDITYMPFEVNENFLGYPTNMNPNFFLIGGFSSPNSIDTILRQTYPKTTINVIRPGYGNFIWSVAPGRDQTLVLSGYPGDPPRTVKTNELIIFRFCRDSAIELAAMVHFIDDNGTSINSVTLPWAARLHEDYGTRTFVLVCPFRSGPTGKTSNVSHTGGACRGLAETGDYLAGRCE